MKKNNKLLLSIIIPCFNEAQTILTVLEKLKAEELAKTEIIIVDDGSYDQTKDLLNKNKKLYTKLIKHQHNLGKGAAVKSGIAQANGEFILIQDADLEYSPEDIPKLLAPVLTADADVVYGSRFKGTGPHRIIYFTHYLANHLITFLCNTVTNLNFTDIETGYKLIRRSLLETIILKETSFGIEPELTIKIGRLQPKTFEVGISYNGRSYQEGKKIGFPDFLRALWVIFFYGLKIDTIVR